MTGWSLLLALATLLPPAALPQSVPVTRADLAGLERKFDRTIPTLDVNDPYDLLGTTRGIYLPNFGVVFTTELNLVVTTISPFLPELTVSDIEKLHRKKLTRVPALKQCMRKMLVEAAADLKGVPVGERIVLGVTIFYRQFEIKDNLPRQIVMQAPRKALLDFKAGRIDSAALDAAIRTQEF
jgi:hypothetical protein